MKYLKNIILVGIFVFSFYFSDKLLLYVEGLSPIMKTIDSNYQEYEIEPVNSIINDDTIIVGSNGKSVNKRESYLKMNDFGKFNDTFFVYDNVKPDISLQDNLDKIIIGSSKYDSISLIINNESLINYLDDNNIYYSILIDNLDNIKIKENVDYINTSVNNFRIINNYLRRKKVNNKLCLVNYSNIEKCKNNKSYLIKPYLEINKNNIASSKSEIMGGIVILINDDINLNEFKYIINYIKYRNLNIIKLSELISE